MKQTSTLTKLKRNAILASMMLGLAFSSCNVFGDIEEEESTPTPAPANPQPNPGTQNGNDGNGQSSGGSTNTQTGNETSDTTTTTGETVDELTGSKYYTKTDKIDKKNEIVNTKENSLAGEDLGAKIDASGNTTLNTDAENSVSATIKTTLYKDTTTTTTTYYTDKNLTNVATDKPVDISTDTVYHAEAVVTGSTLKTTIKSANYTATKTVDVRQYFDAKTQLESSGMPTAGSVVDFSSRVAEIAKADALSLLPSGATLADDKITVPTATIAMPSGYEYDYQNDIANAHFNVKMSDVETINTSTASKDLIANVTSYVTKNINGDYLRAIKFADNVKILNIDLGSSDTNLTYKYKGGIIANNATTSFSNANGAKLSGNMYDDQLKNNTLFKGLSTDKNLPELAFRLMSINGDAGNEEDSNLFGTGIDNIVENYYNNNKLSSVNITTSKYASFSFNAKSYLNGANMFSETGYNGNAYTLNANAAALMLNGGVDVANVAITGTNSTGKTSFTGDVANIYTTTDWSSITSTGKQYGMMYFTSKPPSQSRTDTNADSHLKVVLASENAYNSKTAYKPNGYSALDISALNTADQNSILNQSDSFTQYFNTVYYGNGVSATMKNSNKLIYTGSTANGNLDYDITNVSWENHGAYIIENGGNVNGAPELTAKNGNSISRLNNTKLSPIEKLLLGEQHIYG